MAGRVKPSQILETPQQLASLIGAKINSAKEIVISQSLIDNFCAVSGDYQNIHSEGDTAAIVPGNLLLALLPQLIQSTIKIDQFSKCVTAKYRNVRFLCPVFAREEINLQLRVEKVKTMADKSYVEMSCWIKKDDTTVVEVTISEVYYL